MDGAKAKAFLHECAPVVHSEAFKEAAEPSERQLPWNVEEWHAEVGSGQHSGETASNGEPGFLQWAYDEIVDIVDEFIG